MPNRPLTNKQLAFCREYVIDSNGKQAAIRAGYSANGAEVRGSELLTLSKVKEEIARIDAEMRRETVRTVQSIDAMQQAAYDLAMKNNQPSAAVSAGTAIARLYGMDKDTQTTIDPVEELTVTEVEELKAMTKAATGLRLSPPQADTGAKQA